MRTRAAQKDVWESAFLTFFRHSHAQPGGGGRWGGRLRRARIRAFLLLIFCYFIALTCCNRKWCPQPPAGTSRLLCAGSALASALSVCQFISPPGHPVRRATSFLLLYWDARRRARTWPRPSESRLSLLFSIFYDFFDMDHFLKSWLDLLQCGFMPFLGIGAKTDSGKFQSQGGPHSWEGRTAPKEPTQPHWRHNMGTKKWELCYLCWKQAEKGGHS